MVPPFLSGFVLWETEFLREVETDNTEMIISYFLSFRSLPKEIIVIASSFFPAVFLALFFSQPQTRVSLTGYSILVFLIVGLLITIPQLMFWDPDNQRHISSLTQGHKAISSIYRINEFVAYSFLSYLGMIFGIKLGDNKNGD